MLGLELWLGVTHLLQMRLREGFDEVQRDNDLAILCLLLKEHGLARSIYLTLTFDNNLVRKQGLRQCLGVTGTSN